MTFGSVGHGAYGGSKGEEGGLRSWAHILAHTCTLPCSSSTSIAMFLVGLVTEYASCWHLWLTSVAKKLEVFLSSLKVQWSCEWTLLHFSSTSALNPLRPGYNFHLAHSLGGHPVLTCRVSSSFPKESRKLGASFMPMNARKNSGQLSAGLLSA